MDPDALKLAVESLEGDFELVRELGRGATAVVYLLRDHGLERDVAFKVIRSGVATDEEALARLHREAHLVAQLNHPNIVRLYGTHFLPGGGFGLLMEHVPGRNLKMILRKEGRFPIPRVLSILGDVASALAYAHRRRIVHRDVKPENIYIDEEVGTARLADFGIARPWDQDSRLTLPGSSLGTPAYMSPEEIDGKEVDGRSDVYSLGLVGYEMILGHHPWEGENVFTTIFKHKNEPLPMDLPGLERYPSLGRILEVSLKKDPGDRWDSAEEFLEVLGTVRSSKGKEPGEPILLPPDPPGKKKEAADAPEGGEDSLAQPGLAPGESGAAPDPAGLPWEAEPDIAPPPWLSVILEDEHADGQTPPDPSRGAAWKIAEGKIRWIAATLILLGISYGANLWLRDSLPGDRSEVFAETPAAPDPQQGPRPARASPEPDPASPEPDPASPGSLRLVPVGGSLLEATVGSRVTLTTIAYSPDASPLSDVPIRFEILEGEGVLESEEVRSDPEGFARNGVQLPRAPGTLLVRAVLPGPDAIETRFRVEVGPGDPREAVPFVGNGQAAPAGELLPEWIGVRVRDQFGNLVPNTLVRFRVLEGGGEVRPTEVLTDDVGRAFARWILGRSPGAQSLAAIVPGVADTLITFSATAGVAAEEDRLGGELANPDAPAVGPAIGDSTAVGQTGTDAPSMASDPPPAPTRIRVSESSFAVGGSYVCAAGRSAPPRCRGSLDSPRQIIESEGTLRALSAGVSHVCGLEEDGTAWCWGGNDAGQLGDGTTQDRPEGARVETEGRFSILAAGVSHTCGLDSQGAVTCWGRSLNGQLGNGSRSDRSFPTPVQGDLRFASLASGWNHTCGTTNSGETYCWGLNRHGQLGDGTRIDRLNPVRVPGNFRSLTAGAQHTCGIVEAGALCWGDNSYGQTGSGEGSETRATPMRVSGLPSPPVSLAAGAVHTCALMEGGSAYCWGQNLHGQLGNGTNINAHEPTPVVGNLRFRALFAGGAVTCGITDNGTEYCWGMNQGGQLGDGTRVNRSSPVQVGGGPR